MVMDTSEERMWQEYRRTGNTTPLLELWASYAYTVVKREKWGWMRGRDVAQTALVILWGAIRRHDPTRGASFKTFLCQTIHGEMKNASEDGSPNRRSVHAHMMRLSRTLYENSESPAVWSPAPPVGHDLEIEEFWGVVRACLSAEQGFAAERYYRYGESMPRIARGLKCCHQNVSLHINHALERLREPVHAKRLEMYLEGSR